MKNVTRIDQVDLSVFRKIRVAAYCRVSTNTEDQELSLTTQKEHYESYIKANNEWEYAGIYYDEGISGTKLKNRTGLKQLVEDCEKGLIDLILTKSISRFCRNTTDCLELVRKLIDYDVYVMFEKENIHTGSMESELMLAILASMAEEESHSISENEKWSVKKRFMDGSFIIAYPPYGYANINGEMIVVPEEAKIVKEVFEMCLSGKSTHAISKILNERCVPTKRGRRWTDATVNSILSNEKYTGDALFQKTFTDDSFKRRRNHGECEQYLCSEHHEAIVSKDIFEKAEAVIRQRASEKGISLYDTSKYMNRYAFSGKLICGECGKTFKRRSQRTTKNKNSIAWCCNGHIQDVKSCSMKSIWDDDIKRAFLILMNKLRFGNDLVLKPLLISLTALNTRRNSTYLEEIEKAIAVNEEQRLNLNTMLNKGYLEKPIFVQTHNKLMTEFESLKYKRELILRMDKSGYSIEQCLEEFIDFLSKSDVFTEYDDALFERWFEKVTIYSRTEYEFELKFGLKLRERID